MTAKANVFVKGPPFKDITEATFLDEKEKYNIVTSLRDADVCVFTGGEDINPVLYNEEPIKGTYFSSRDKSDLDTLDIAYGQGKFLVGICRGAQLLNCVPNEGSLWQDVDNHDGTLHRTFDCITGSWFTMNSVHHQMMRVTHKAEILAWADEATIKVSQKETWRKVTSTGEPSEKDKDPEAVWYPDTRSLLIQGHPEFGHPTTTKYFMGLMDRYYFGKGL